MEKSQARNVWKWGRHPPHSNICTCQWDPQTNTWKNWILTCKQSSSHITTTINAPLEQEKSFEKQSRIQNMYREHYLVSKPIKQMLQEGGRIKPSLIIRGEKNIKWLNPNETFFLFWCWHHLSILWLEWSVNLPHCTVELRKRRVGCGYASHLGFSPESPSGHCCKMVMLGNLYASFTSPCWKR